jgi:uncharacterized protein
MSDPSTPPVPLFPLRAVLFPGGHLPLQIFEVRYLDMIARHHRAGEPFGVVCLSAGSEVRQRDTQAGSEGFAPEAFHPIGTLARIDDLQRPHPGLLRVRCTGTQRFRVQASRRGPYGLWLADIETLADDATVPVPDDLAFAREAMRRLVQRIDTSIATGADPGIERPIREPYRWNDCGWLANRWCDVLPLDAPAKQRLLTLDSPVLRLELVADALVQMGVNAAE